MGCSGPGGGVSAGASCLVRGWFAGDGLVVCASSRRGCSVVRVPGVWFVVTWPRGTLALGASVLVWGVVASAFGGPSVCLLLLA